LITNADRDRLPISFGISGDNCGKAECAYKGLPISRQLYNSAYYVGERMGKSGKTIIPIYPPKNKSYPQAFPQAVFSIICITGFLVKKPAIYLRKL
jgi:hypothetical protein